MTYLDWSSLVARQPVDYPANYRIGKQAVLMLLSSFDYLRYRSTWLNVSDAEFDAVQSVVDKLVLSLTKESEMSIKINKYRFLQQYVVTASVWQTMLMDHANPVVWEDDTIYQAQTYFQVRTAGLYRIESLHRFNVLPQTAAHRLTVRYLKNGNTVIPRQDTEISIQSGLYLYPSVRLSTVERLAIDDTITMQMYCTSNYEIYQYADYSSFTVYRVPEG